MSHDMRTWAKSLTATSAGPTHVQPQPRRSVWRFGIRDLLYSVRRLDWADHERHAEYQRLRGEVFVGQRGWDLPVELDGREWDRYDKAGGHAVWAYGVYGIDPAIDAEHLLGGVRVFVLRHWDDSMLTHEFREAGMIPDSVLIKLRDRMSAHDAVELTRLCVRSGRHYSGRSCETSISQPPAFEISVARDLVYAASYAAAEQSGRRYALAIVDTPYLHVMQRARFVFETLHQHNLRRRGGYGLVLIDLRETIRNIAQSGGVERARTMLLCCEHPELWGFE